MNKYRYFRQICSSRLIYLPAYTSIYTICYNRDYWNKWVNLIGYRQAQNYTKPYSLDNCNFYIKLYLDFKEKLLTKICKLQKVQSVLVKHPDQHVNINNLNSKTVKCTSFDIAKCITISWETSWSSSKVLAGLSDAPARIVVQR